MIYNAKITGTMLGIEDHGMFTSYIYLEWDHGGVGFGGYVLGTSKQQTALAIPYLQRLMEVVGVEKWEDLKGKYVRVETGGPGTIATRIGNLIKDDWLDNKEFFNGSKGHE